MKKINLTMKLVCLVCFVGVLYFLGVYVTYRPSVEMLEKCITTALGQVKVCKGGENYTDLKDISNHVINAIIYSEDAGFYGHKGIDVYELKESLKKNIKSLSYKRGGSTLTQQLAKNIFLSPQKSLTRKIKEYKVAKIIEKKYSKSFILEKYLNVVEFGRGIYGVKQAANTYFKLHPKDLNPLQASFLAYLLPSPKKYAKFFGKTPVTRFAKKRLRQILYKLKFYKKITIQKYDFYISNIHDIKLWGHQPPIIFEEFTEPNFEE